MHTWSSDWKRVVIIYIHIGTITLLPWFTPPRFGNRQSQAKPVVSMKGVQNPTRPDDCGPHTTPSHIEWWRWWTRLDQHSLSLSLSLSPSPPLAHSKWTGVLLGKYGLTQLLAAAGAPKCASRVLPIHRRCRGKFQSHLDSNCYVITASCSFPPRCSGNKKRRYSNTEDGTK
jgi:hypothetical protein